MTLPLAGTTSGNGTFSGTLAISSVGSDGSGGVFVEGLVTGTVTRANKTPLGTIVSVPVRLPLQGNWPRGLAQQAPGDSIVLAPKALPESADLDCLVRAPKQGPPVFRLNAC